LSRPAQGLHWRTAECDWIHVDSLLALRAGARPAQQFQTELPRIQVLQPEIQLFAKLRQPSRIEQLREIAAVAFGLHLKHQQSAPRMQLIWPEGRQIAEQRAIERNLHDR